MNGSFYKFRCYEDPSLTYAGIGKHKDEHVGLFDTSMSELDYLEAAQQDSPIFPNGLDKRQLQATQHEDDSIGAEAVDEAVISVAEKSVSSESSDSFTTDKPSMIEEISDDD